MRIEVALAEGGPRDDGGEDADVPQLVRREPQVEDAGEGALGELEHEEEGAGAVEGEHAEEQRWGRRRQSR